MNIIKKYGWLAYLVFISIITFQSIRYDFLILSKSFEIAVICCYYLLSVIGLYSFWKNEKSKGIYLIMIMTCGLVLSHKAVVLLPIALLSLISFNARYKFSTRVILPLFLILLILRWSIGFVVTDFISVDYVSVTEVQRVANSNDTLEFVVTEHDQGALGVDSILYVEKEYYGLFVRKKQLANVDYGEKIIWIDDDTLSVGNKSIDVN